MVPLLVRVDSRSGTLLTNRTAASSHMFHRGEVLCALTHHVGIANIMKTRVNYGVSLRSHTHLGVSMSKRCFCIGLFLRPCRLGGRKPFLMEDFHNGLGNLARSVVRSPLDRSPKTSGENTVWWHYSWGYDPIYPPSLFIPVDAEVPMWFLSL